MGKTSTSSTLTPQPSWFTAKRLLAIFCLINLLNYVDRGAIASNGVNGKPGECTKSGACSSGSGIQGDFNLSNFQDGVISSAFMVGLLLASPIFASLAKSVNPFRLIGVGLTVWTFATAGCGLSINFWSITICRMLVGVGEASFISLAAPFIDDNAPFDQKTAWLGTFYMCIPTGIAVGYVYGGLVGSLLNWRWAFLIEALLMLPFAILGFVMKPLQLKGFSHTGSKRPSTSVQTSCTEAVALPSQDGSFQTRSDSKDDSKSAPKIVNQLTRFWKDMKVLLLEKVYVVNILGYVAYNFVIGAYSYWGPKAGYYIYHMILSVATFFGALFCFAAFCFKSLYAFIALFAIGELLVFAIQGPVNYVCLHCVKPSMRPLSMAMSTVLIHIFGDVPSSPLVGVLEVWIFLHGVDRFNEENEHQVSVADRTNTIPLLEETTQSL
ncbi:unnamed protein product [Withania somnifera]